MKTCPLCNLKRKCTCAADNGHVKKARLFPKCRDCGDRHANKGSCKQAWADPDMFEAIEWYFEKFAGIPRNMEKLLPANMLDPWIRRRCGSRKSMDDWGSVTALYRDFCVSTDGFSRISFEQAIARAGYAVSRGMVSKLYLKEDLL